MSSRVKNKLKRPNKLHQRAKPNPNQIKQNPERERISGWRSLLTFFFDSIAGGWQLWVRQISYEPRVGIFHICSWNKHHRRYYPSIRMVPNSTNWELNRPGSFHNRGLECSQWWDETIATNWELADPEVGLTCQIHSSFERGVRDHPIF